MRISDWSSDVCSSDLRDRGEQTLPRFGEAHAALFAHEERAAEPVLQLADLITHRRLRQPQFLGGAREILQTTGGFEGAPGGRSEERRVGKEWCSPCRSLWSAYH